jgi:poly(3-hydroxybutyrate) depolymerase
MLPKQRIATLRFPLQGATNCLRAALVASLSFAVACVGSSGGEETPGTAGSTGGGSTAGHGGTTGSAGTGQAGNSQAGTGGSSSGAGGTTGAGATTGAAGTGGAGTMGGTGGGSAGTSGAGGSGGAAGAGPGDGGRGGYAGGGGRGGNGGTLGRGGDGGAGGRGGAGGSGGAVGTGGAGTGGGGGGATGMSSGCGKTPGIASSMYNNGSTIAITAANLQRRYILNVPTNYDNNKPYKLIIAFHQLDGNDKQMYANGYYHLLNLSGNNAIFVAPNGQKNGSPCTTTGNGDGGCGWPNGSNSDIALADAMVKQVEDNFCVDTNRIFATGWSYGASMSYKTGCERPLGGGTATAPGFIRAIAIYSGAQLSGNCTPSRPVAFYGSHGDNDSVLNYDGGVTLARNFATANGCTWATPTKVANGSAHVCTNVSGCMTGYPVQFCSFDGDHTPDPRDPGMSSGSWQYQVVWNWFNQF